MRHGGRPRLGDDVRKQQMLIKLRPAMRKRIETYAEENGYYKNRIIEIALEKFFKEIDDKLK